MSFHHAPLCLHTRHMWDAQTKLLYSRREAANLLGISLRSFDELVSTHKIEVSRIGKRVLVTRRALLGFVQRISTDLAPSIENGRASMADEGR